MTAAVREPLKAPFPYFGGKARVASLVWQRFGWVPNYVEPFAGSLAVLLARPHDPKTETVNDLCGWLTNFWRAVKADPDGVAGWADWPVSELDLHARGDWLFYRPEAAEFVERMRSDPEFYDAKSAGWWVWGACAWIGTGWGPRNAGQGINRQLPHVGNAGRGINRQLPHVGDAGRGAVIRRYMRDLSDRLRGVRVICGDWRRTLTPSVTTRHGVTAVLLDPPYGDGQMDYAAGGNRTAVAADARAWAVEHGDDPKFRIALCGYDGAAMPAGWSEVRWKNRGGYGSQGDGDGRANAARERIWFSPHCLRPDGADLFHSADHAQPSTRTNGGGRSRSGRGSEHSPTQVPVA